MYIYIYNHCYRPLDLVILNAYVRINIFTFVYIPTVANNDTSPLKLRLIGDSDKQGRIEILYYGVWGYVCQESFSFNSANVACRCLGFPGAVSVQHKYSPYSTTPIWLSDVQCIGNETGLEQCPHLGFGNSEYFCGSLHVGVVCIGMYICINFSLQIVVFQFVN